MRSGSVNLRRYKSENIKAINATIAYAKRSFPDAIKRSGAIEPLLFDVAGSKLAYLRNRGFCNGTSSAVTAACRVGPADHWVLS